MIKKTHTYKKVNNLAIKVDVFSPENGNNNSPVIVLLHGGALMYCDRLCYSPDGPDKHFFQMGATVISVDYRLAPETKLPEIIKDIQDCFKWIHSEGKDIYNYNSEKVIVAGHSAGGYLTMMCGFCLDNNPQGLISYFGYGDITKPWYSEPDPFYSAMDIVKKEDVRLSGYEKETTCDYEGRNLGALYLYYRQNGLWTKEVGGVDPQKNPEFFEQYEPIKNISKDYPPTLLLHGDKDTDVPYSKSSDMAKALTETGVENELITIKDGAHGFHNNVEDEQVIAATKKVKEFIKDIFAR